ncbi:Uncharacterized protein ACMD2_05510, partial [Ananas comosus]
MKGNTMNNLQPFITFLLGAAAATVFILFFVSSNAGERSFEILALRNGTQRAEFSSEEEAAGNISVASSLEEVQVVANGTKLMAPKEEEQQQEDDNKEGAASSDEQELVGILRAAAMDGDTVIMTSLNEAWAAPGSLLDLFLESFHVGEQIGHLLNHLVIVAVDPEALARCKSVHPYCYYLRVGDAGADFTKEKVFMSKDYLDMMWSRNRFQQKILELGYNFLFTDVDILWFRNPFRHISLFAHITFSSDLYRGNPDDLGNFPNGGFLYVKSSNRTIEFYKNWYLVRDRWPGANEQWVFNQIKHNFSAEYGVNIQFIDTAICSGFCSLGKDLNRICTVHANCCVGLGNKLYDLRNLISDWKNYTALPWEEKMKGWFSWRVP